MHVFTMQIYATTMNENEALILKQNNKDEFGGKKGKREI